MPPSQRFVAVLEIAFAISACATAHNFPKIAVTESVTGLAFYSADGSLLKTGAAGLFRLGSSDSSWQAITTPATSGLTGLAVNPDELATLYVSGPGAGVLKSTDAGQHWAGAGSGLPDGEITALALHSFRRATLYAWVKDTWLYRTEDAGAHLDRMSDPSPPVTQVRN